MVFMAMKNTVEVFCAVIGYHFTVKAAQSSKMLVSYHIAIQHLNPEDHDFSILIRSCSASFANIHFLPSCGN